MAVMNMVLYPDDPLTKKARKIEVFGPELPQLVDDMIDTMHAFQGVGLAAPQVGIARRLFVLCEPEREPICLVNPEITASDGSEKGEEGCLSLPRMYAQVPRATHIQVRAQDAQGKPMEFEATDFLARIIQHELDHLDGILFPDRLDIISREEVLGRWKDMRAELDAAGLRK